MRILVTNDDGYYSNGLRVLSSIMREFGDLTVIAPKYHQSGTSMAVTMGFKPIAVKELDSLEYGASSPDERWFYLDGTPASCVKFGIDNIMRDSAPDLVVSGINYGANAATATLYSGTIGAVMEATVNGIPAIGVSLDTFDIHSDFSCVEHFLPGIIRKILAAGHKGFGTFYNINFPNLQPDTVKGIRVAHTGSICWIDEFQDYDPAAYQKTGISKHDMGLDLLPEPEEGEHIYMMTGQYIERRDNDTLSDHRLLKQGYITISAQAIDNTDYNENTRLRACGMDEDLEKI